MQSIARVHAHASPTPSSNTGVLVPPLPNSNTSNPVDFPCSSRCEAQSASGESGQLAGSLGTNAKSSAAPPLIDPETGEVLGVNLPHNPMLARLQRFAEQAVARSILPKSRTNNCLRLRQGMKQIQVWQSTEFKTTAYSGLQTCGSVWACPVCSAKISSRRRVEIIAAMAAHKALGGCMNLLTLTAPHQRHDKLDDLLVKQAVALKYFYKDFSVNKVFSEMGLIGQIRALEVTHGRLRASNNGWHPHYHILQFAGLGPDLSPSAPFLMDEWASRLYTRWAACCVRAGLGSPSQEHGLRLHDGSAASTYVAKWGLEDEMTKGHTKKANQGETPYDLLRAVLANPKDKQARALFAEFADVFKGKRQLYWSAGLKKRYAIGESSDEELSFQMEDYAVLLGTITVEQWRNVLRVEGRGVLLQVAATGGWPAVIIFFESITDPGEPPDKKIIQ
jgi:hypothetical protein